MTYTDSGVYVVQTTSALEARKAIRPETLAIELDPRYCSVQRGDARHTALGDARWARDLYDRVFRADTRENGDRS